jgi:hypothetical protein
VLELAQTLREHVGGDPGQLLLELAETAGTGEQRVHDQKAPPVADAGQRRPEPVLCRLFGHLRHGCTHLLHPW